MPRSIRARSAYSPRLENFMACYRAVQRCGRRCGLWRRHRTWNPSTPSLRSVRREIYFSCNDGSVQAQQNQLALWFSFGIWFFGMMIMSCLCCLCLPMCAKERDGKRSQSTEMNQSNQLFHNLSPPSFVNVYSSNMIYNLLLFE